MTTWELRPWLRRSRRCWLAVLFTLMVALPGLSGCAIPGVDPYYTVPGVRGQVHGGLQIGFDGRRYYGVETVVDGRLHQRVVYEGSHEYALIDAFFRSLGQMGSAPDRSNIPGGAGSLPPPAVP